MTLKLALNLLLFFVIIILLLLLVVLQLTPIGKRSIPATGSRVVSGAAISGVVSFGVLAVDMDEVKSVKPLIILYFINTVWFSKEIN